MISEHHGSHVDDSQDPNTYPAPAVRLGSFIIASAVALTACSRVDLQWSEQVRLADGRMIVVDRTAQGKKHAEIGGPKGWRAAEMTVAVSQAPDTIKRPPAWRGAYGPVLLDYRPTDHTWSLLATIYYCEEWYELGRPQPPYLQYQSTNGASWRRVPVEERFIDRPTNLLTGPRSDGEPDLVTIADKELSQQRAAAIYNRILRKWGRFEENYCDPS